MPEVFIYMFQGRTLDQKRELARSVTDAVAQSLSVAPELVTIQLVEGPKENRARAGQLIVDKSAPK